MTRHTMPLKGILCLLLACHRLSCQLWGGCSNAGCPLFCVAHYAWARSQEDKWPWAETPATMSKIILSTFKLFQVFVTGRVCWTMGEHQSKWPGEKVKGNEILALEHWACLLRARLPWLSPYFALIKISVLVLILTQYLLPVFLSLKGCFCSDLCSDPFSLC